MACAPHEKRGLEVERGGVVYAQKEKILFKTYHRLEKSNDAQPQHSKPCVS